MSYGDGAGAYTPPPPPAAKGRSPWFYFGIGCLVLFVLIVGGCIAGGAYFANQFNQESKKPFNKAEAIASIGDVPQYPDAKISEEGTKAMRSVLGVMKFAMPSESNGMLAVATNDEPSKVHAFYDKKLVAMGYKLIQQKQTSSVNSQEQHIFQKDKDAVLIQTQVPQGGTQSFGGKTLLVIMRFNKMKGNAKLQ